MTVFLWGRKLPPCLRDVKPYNGRDRSRGSAVAYAPRFSLFSKCVSGYEVFTAPSLTLRED